MTIESNCADLRGAIWERLQAEEPKLVTREGYLLIGAGIPIICGFGPPGGNAHAANKYVEVDGLLLTAKIYAAAARDLLAPDKRKTQGVL